MIANFLTSKAYNIENDVTFCYRYSKSYEAGYRARVKTAVKDLKFYTIDLSRIHIFGRYSELSFFRLLRLFLRLAMLYPVFLFNMLQFLLVLRQTRPDLLHINNGGYPGTLSARAAAIAGWLFGIRNIVMVVNNEAYGYNSVTRFFEWPIDRLISKAVGVFITGSQSSATALNHLFKQRIRVKVLNNGIDVAGRDIPFSSNSSKLINDQTIIGVVALHEERKGHIFLLHAIKEIISSNCTEPNFKLFIEGEGKLTHSLKNYVFENNLNEFVTFVGPVKNIFQFIEGIDILVLPSISHEDFPNVILEGMALGTTIIASEIAGIPEQIVDGQSGFLFPIRDTHALAKKLSLLIEDRELREKFAERAKIDFDRKFTSQKAVRRYIDLYEQIRL